MDTQIIFNIAIACAGGLALWVLNSMTRQIQKLEDQISAMKDNLPHDYVQKADYRDDVKELKDMLRQLFDKLDAKADKSAAV